VLLRHFGSLKKLRAASVQEIAELPGFGQRSAQAIVAVLADPVSVSAPAVNTATGELLDGS
jgi:excinuclease ABC subunit C